jgi:hypothetical protein
MHMLARVFQHGLVAMEFPVVHCRPISLALLIDQEKMH